MEKNFKGTHRHQSSGERVEVHPDRTPTGQAWVRNEEDREWFVTDPKNLKRD